MNMSMKIVVGTLHCGENEFEACCAAISSQTLEPIEHFVLKDLPNREAHEKLYCDFMKRSGPADLFVKVDADMVLSRKTFFAELSDIFTTDLELDHLQIVVDDFFTGHFIEGLNVFRSTCKWTKKAPNSLYVDHTPVNRRKSLTDWSVLAPSATHCPDPSPFQAFHFGMHKGLKVLEAIQSTRHDRLLRHWSNIELTWKNYLKTKDIRLLLASLGAELALSGMLTMNNINTNDEYAVNVFKEYENWNHRWLSTNVRIKRRLNRRCLPSDWYLAFLRKEFTGYLRDSLKKVLRRTFLSSKLVK